MTFLIYISVGFIIGLFYSRGRVDPVKDAAAQVTGFAKSTVTWIKTIIRG
jgi:hypothetical protein